jgi:hypothetical protein
LNLAATGCEENNTMRARFPKFLTVGLATAALTAAIGGAALAQTPPSGMPSGTPPAGVQQRAEEFLNALAGKLGKTPAEVRAAVVAVQKERIAADVQAGRLTQQQADQLNQRIDQTGGLGLFGGGPKGGPGHHGGRGMGTRGGFGGPLAVAQFLGMQPQELGQALASGKSLAQVAQEKGKSRDELKSYLTTQQKTRLDQAVQAGRLTQQQADQRLAELSSRLDQLIDRTGPVGGGRGTRGPGGFGPRGGPAPAATPRANA